MDKLSQYLLYMSLAGGVVADIIIAGALCVTLSRSRTGFQQYVKLIFARITRSLIFFVQNRLNSGGSDDVYD
jgi:hypothetical protein